MTDAANRLVPAIEAILFASGKPVSEKDLAQLLESSPEEIREALQSLADRAVPEDRGVSLEEVAGGWRYVTRPEHDGLLRRFFEISERSRLSLAALETLAIIAYRQPITAPEISDLRGVNSSGVMKTLFDRKLITTAGKKPVVGTPFFYRTTREFLIRFGLNDLADLPRPEELDSDFAAEPAEPDGQPAGPADESPGPAETASEPVGRPSE
ncbi:MAG: SMC-Scp complex subunit ScpB [Thermoanaerobaculia bacterium]